MEKVNASNIKIKTYHGVNREVVSWTTNNLAYSAVAEWNDAGEFTSITYGRTFPNAYYDLPSVFVGNTEGMENKPVRVEFGKLPEYIYLSIKKEGDYTNKF